MSTLVNVLDLNLHYRLILYLIKGLIRVDKKISGIVFVEILGCGLVIFCREVQYAKPSASRSGGVLE